MGLFKFYWTDAIAGISGGVKINYIDLECGDDVTSYTIIGHYLLTNPNSTQGWSIIINKTTYHYDALMLGVYFANNTLLNYSYQGYKIRVFYI